MQKLNQKQRPLRKSKQSGKKKGKKKKSKAEKVFKIILKILLVLAIGTAIILFLFVSPVFNIQEIKVTGANEIGESVYIAISEINNGENIFEINKSDAISRIMKEPYVESVEINSIYPNKIEIVVKERKISYIVEVDSKYYYLDKNGYILEEGFSKSEFPEIKGMTTNFKNMDIGKRINEEDLGKFNDLIRIMDSMNNNSINANLTNIDISDKDSYILEFKEENKKIMLGQATDLSAKMAWINLFINDKKDEKGILHLNTPEVYFSPEI